LGILLFAVIAMLVYRDRRNDKRIRDLQASMPNTKGAALDQDPEEFQSPYRQGHELATGLDRGELPSGYESHEMPERPRYEMT